MCFKSALLAIFLAATCATLATASPFTEDRAPRDLRYNLSLLFDGMRYQFPESFGQCIVDRNAKIDEPTGICVMKNVHVRFWIYDWVNPKTGPGWDYAGINYEIQFGNMNPVPLPALKSLLYAIERSVEDDSKMNPKKDIVCQDIKLTVSGTEREPVLDGVCLGKGSQPAIDLHMAVDLETAQYRTTLSIEARPHK